MKTDLIKNIINIVSWGLGNSDPISISNDEDLILLGLSSISFVTIIVSLEEEFQITIPNEKLILSQMNTIDKISEIIEMEMEKNNEY